MAATITFNNKTNKVSSGGSYRYPKDHVYDNFTDYVRFDFYKYNPPFQFGTSGVTPDGNGDYKLNQTASTLDGYNASAEQLTPSGLNTIFLYMPEDIQSKIETQWAGKGFTNTGADILRLSGGGIGGKPGQTLANIGQMIGRVAERGPSVGAQAIVEALNKLPGGIGGEVNIEDVLGGIGGVILNPNTELMFGGFGLRQFDLSFKMSPRDSKEAKEIRAICNTFKKASLPSYSTAPDDFWTKSGDAIGKWFNPDAKPNEDTNSNYIGIPNLCQVTFMSGPSANKYVSQFKTCAITSVNVNYTPDGSYATYGGSTESDDDTKSPVATELSLGFTETKLLFRQEITIDGASY
jgi:hypothetical protein